MSRFRYLLGAAILAWLVAPAYADTITTFTLSGVTFDDGGTATGQFTVDFAPDFTTGTITSANITTSDHVLFSLPFPIGFGEIYDATPPFDAANFINNPAQFSFSDFFFIGNDGLAFNLANPLTLADVTAPHNSFSVASGSESFSFGPLSGTRNITAGSLEIGATPLPAALPLFASGAGLIGGMLGWRRKRKSNHRGKPLEASAAAA